MLFSLSMIFLCGMIFGGIFARLRLPSLLGMLLTGMLLGPYGLNLLSPEILMISADLRRIALIIILTRAGLNLDLSELKKVGALPSSCASFRRPLRLPGCFFWRRGSLE